MVLLSPRWVVLVDIHGGGMFEHMSSPVWSATGSPLLTTAIEPKIYVDKRNSC